MAGLNQWDRFFKQNGAVSFYDDVVERKSMYTTYERTHMFRHYFNAQGTEVGYITLVFLNCDWYQPGPAHIFETPRVWGIPHRLEPLKAELEYCDYCGAEDWDVDVQGKYKLCPGCRG